MVQLHKERRVPHCDDRSRSASDGWGVVEADGEVWRALCSAYWACSIVCARTVRDILEVSSESLEKVLGAEKGWE